MLHEFACDISADVMLFDDHVVTEFEVPGALVRSRRDDESIFEHTVEPVGDYVVQAGADVVATGGFLRHYNVPFADLHMEVRADRRRQGYGSLLLQEVKKACYLTGRVPAARCAVSNTASRATPTKAGFRICGYLQRGVIKARSEWPAIDS